MQLTTEWHEEGRREGVTATVLRQLRRRLGEVATPAVARIDALPVEQLERLADDLLDFSTPADLARWLDQQI